MSKTKWIPFPIDNKNVLEDFTDVFHGGDFIERRHHGIVRQAFYNGSALWEVVYRLGDNRFEVVLHENFVDKDFYKDRIRPMIMSLCDKDSLLSVEVNEGESMFVCHFMKGIE